MNTAAIPMPLSWSMRLLERNLLPDSLVRLGIRRLLKARLAEERQDSAEAQQNLKDEGLITTEEDAAKRAEIL